MYIKNPMEIENKSMDIIEKAMGNTSFTDKEKMIVKRMIHTTGDLEYRNIIVFKENFVERAIDSIKKRRYYIY